MEIAYYKKVMHKLPKYFCNKGNSSLYHFLPCNFWSHFICAQGGKDCSPQCMQEKNGAPVALQLEQDHKASSCESLDPASVLTDSVPAEKPVLYCLPYRCCIQRLDV